MNVVMKKMLSNLFFLLVVSSVEVSGVDNLRAARLCVDLQSVGVRPAWAAALAFYSYGNQQGFFEYLNMNPVVFNEVILSASTEDMVLESLPCPLPLASNPELAPIARQMISLLTFFELIKYKDFKTWLLELHTEAMPINQCQEANCFYHRHK